MNDLSQITQQNAELAELQSKYQTADTLTVYKIQQIQTNVRTNNYLFWLYLILSLTISVLLFTTPNKLSFYYKLAIILMLLLYPIIINPIEQFVGLLKTQ